MTDISEAVELLDVRMPGWRDRIDLQELDMSSCNSCILGQLYGEYTYGLVMLGLVDGRDEDQEWFEASYYVDVDQLQAAWVAELTAGAP